MIQYIKGKVKVVRDIELHFFKFFPETGAAVTPREGQQFRWQVIEEEMPEGLLPNDRPVWEILKKMSNK